MVNQPFINVLRRIKSVYIKIFFEKPTPDEEIEYRENLIHLLNELLKNLSGYESHEKSIEDTLKMIENWDSLDYWFKEVEGLSDKILEIINIAEETRIVIAKSKSVPKTEKIDKKPPIEEKLSEVNVEEIKSQASEAFEDEIAGLRARVLEIRKKMEQKDFEIQAISKEEAQMESTEKVEGKKSETRLVAVKIPKIETLIQRLEPTMMEETQPAPKVTLEPVSPQKSIVEEQKVEVKPEIEVPEKPEIVEEIEPEINPMGDPETLEAIGWVESKAVLEIEWPKKPEVVKKTKPAVKPVKAPKKLKVAKKIKPEIKSVEAPKKPKVAKKIKTEIKSVEAPKKMEPVGVIESEVIPEVEVSEKSVLDQVIETESVVSIEQKDNKIFITQPDGTSIDMFIEENDILFALLGMPMIDNELREILGKPERTLSKSLEKLKRKDLIKYIYKASKEQKIKRGDSRINVFWLLTEKGREIASLILEYLSDEYSKKKKKYKVLTKK